MMELPTRNEARGKDGRCEESDEHEEDASFLNQSHSNRREERRSEAFCAASLSFSSILLLISAGVLFSVYVYQQHRQFQVEDTEIMNNRDPVMVTSNSGGNDALNLNSLQWQQIHNFRASNESVMLHLDVASSGGGSVCGWAQANLAESETWCHTDTFDGMHRKHFLGEEQPEEHAMPVCDEKIRFISILDQAEAQNSPVEQCLPFWIEKDAVSPPSSCCWEDPRFVSVFVMRDPMKRLLAQARAHDTDDWRDDLNDHVVDNYYIKRLEAFASLCDCDDVDSPSKSADETSRLEWAISFLRKITILLTLDCLTDGMGQLSPYLGWKFAGSHPQFEKEAQHYSNYHRHDNVEGPLVTPQQQIGNDTLWEQLVQQNQLDIQLYQWLQEHATVQC